MTEEDIKRINELYKKKVEGTITDDELVEQAKLRGEYIAAIRANLRANLDNTTIQYEDGTRVNLGEKFGNKKADK